MIKRWKISNFKSVAGPTDLPLSPLTVFSGPNSSGKSAFLQSILLVTQTSSHKMVSHPVVLNGSLVKLGTFNDIRSVGSAEDTITLDWTCSLGSKGGHGSTIDRGRISPSARDRVFTTTPRIPLDEVKCQFSFDAVQSRDNQQRHQTQPRLTHALVQAAIQEEEGENDGRKIEIIARSQDDPRSNSSTKWTDVVTDKQGSLKFDVQIDSGFKKEIEEEFVSAELIGCSLDHFLPQSVMIGIDEVKEIAHLLESSIIGEGRAPFFDSRYAEMLIPPDVISILYQHYEEDLRTYIPTFPQNRQLVDAAAQSTYQFPEVSLRDWIMLPARVRLRIQSSLQDDPKCKEAIQSAIRTYHEPYQLLTTRQIKLPDQLSTAVEYLDRFFSNSVHYLGPLRDEPRQLYPDAPHSNPTDVGIRGEMTAAVLAFNSKKEIEYIASARFQDGSTDQVSIRATLSDAVDDWLQYLDIARNVVSRDQGRLGHEVKVKVDDRMSSHYDLMHVGVGVSQVLPILVMALLAEPYSTIIVEQPELHLHPKVQARLADFFLSMALLDKQCLVESHSEYLIDRLRFRAATDETSRVPERVRIYFMTSSEGRSEVFPILINEFGSISEWPEGFFDQSHSESMAILRAASRKRRGNRDDQRGSKSEDEKGELRNLNQDSEKQKDRRLLDWVSRQLNRLWPFNRTSS